MNSISRFLNVFCGGMNSKSKTPRVADYDDGGGVAAINDDVLTEILLRLPAKSLIKFKSVCKRWLPLISGDQFRLLHTLCCHKLQPSLLLCTDNSQFFYFNPVINGEKNPMMMIPYTFTLPNPKILSSCNGLMLLQCDHYYYVYNPTTKQSRKVILDDDHHKYKIEGLNLAFNSSKSPHYRIVCVREGWAWEELLTIEVYDSVSHTWEICLGPFHQYDDAKFSDGVYCDNSIYWKNYDGVRYFDIEKEVIGYLPYTHLPGNSFGNLEQQESNGHLYLFGVGHAGVSLWQLQGDDHHSQDWFLKFHDHSLCWFATPFVFYPWCYARILRFVRGSNDDETSTLFLTHGPGKIRAYKLLDKRFEELVPFLHENSVRLDYQNVYQFSESLAPI